VSAAAGAGAESDGGTGGTVDNDAGAGGVPTPCVDSLALPLLREAPATLAGTGLYASDNADSTQFAPYVRTYRPNYEFWADGATKQRFVYLPACTQIDTSDMDYWKFPVGTRLWKDCGHCHNSYYRTHGASLLGDPAPRLRLSVQNRTVEQTTTYTTLVWVGTANTAYQKYNRLEPCNPNTSSVLLRMAIRSEEQMPPIASKVVDQAAVDLVSQFIRNLHAPGAPACPQ
jgi:hypothetical protein